MIRFKWAINRMRVKIARLIWPRINPLPPLFTAASGPVTIDRVSLYDEDVLLCTIQCGITLRAGDSFSLPCDVEVRTSNGSMKIVAEMCPLNCEPVKLYRKEAL